jgi:uncharacterized membrane protein
MDPTWVFLFTFLLGLLTGLRSFTTPAVVAWAAHLGWIRLTGTVVAFMGGTPGVAIFTLLAAWELIWDKLPKTPRRTAPPGLIARLVSGGLVGACLGVAGHQSIYFCASLGAMGGLFGAHLGYLARTRTVLALGVPDFVIALIEDAIAVGGAFFILSRF